MKPLMHKKTRHYRQAFMAGFLALPFLLAGAVQANALSLTESSKGELQATNNTNAIGGDAAGNAVSTLIAPDLTVCDERNHMISRLNADGDLQVCSDLGGGVWDWSNYQLSETNFSNDAVVGQHIPSLAIGQHHIQVDAVGGDQVRANSLSSSKLMANTITNRELALNAVGTNQLQNLAVTTQKIMDLAASTDKFANGSVTRVKTTGLLDENGVVAVLKTKCHTNTSGRFVCP